MVRVGKHVTQGNLVVMVPVFVRLGQPLVVGLVWTQRAAMSTVVRVEKPVQEGRLVSLAHVSVQLDRHCAMESV